jgi:hypothetical protein
MMDGEADDLFLKAHFNSSGVVENRQHKSKALDDVFPSLMRRQTTFL